MNPADDFYDHRGSDKPGSDKPGEVDATVDPNPFRASAECVPPSRSPDDSIAFEPHFSGEALHTDPSEGTAGKGLDPLGGVSRYDDRVEHTVWDEPGRSQALSGNRSDSSISYERWLEDGIREYTPEKTWLVWLGIVLFAGPWSVLATIVSQWQTAESLQLLNVCLFGPLLEEFMKASALLWVVEKRPYMLRSRFQICTAAAASGLGFAVIENFMYLYVYIDAPTSLLAVWRWTVCVALHVGCTTLAGIGLSKVWQDAMQNRKRPDITLASKWIIASFVCHALYNSGAVLLEVALVR